MTVSRLIRETPTIPSDPLRRSLAAQFIEDFAALGARLRLETNSRPVLDACRRSFGGYGVPPPTAEHPLVVRVLVDPAFTETPPWPEPVFRGHDEIFYVTVGRQNTMIADLDRSRATGFIAPAMATDEVFFRRTFVDCLVLTMLTFGSTSPYTYVHASAVSRGPRGVLFSGPSGSGKTTLAFACVRRGFEAVSDDVVYLQIGPEGLMAWGRPWHLKLLADCRRFFPELGGLPQSSRDGRDCVEVEVERSLNGRTRTHCLPQSVFFLEPSAGPPVLERVQADEAAQLLARDLVYDRPQIMDRHHRVWRELVSRGAYRLFVGESPDRAAALVEELLERSTTDANGQEGR